ncbi:MAG: LysM peptidoglycan-binding domain-containing protein [Deltaproteobacteria bacterium]|nr:LysM peptidoglycan-binding domain-containing protein [Deltaproteobacteria bacterium]
MEAMKNCLARSVARISTVIFASILVTAAATRSYSAPSEESISGSSSAQMPRLRSVQSSERSTWSEDPGNEPTTEESDQGRSEGENAGIPGAASSETAVPRPRAVFPYTVRPGDTPGGIAALFGVPLADLLRINHLHEDSELQIGDSLRVPNPFLARERELSSELDRLTGQKQSAEKQAHRGQQAISDLHAKVEDLSAANKQYEHDLHVLPWWRGAALLAAGAAALMLGIMSLAVIQWLITRSRFQAVAEMNESLRRLDYKYKAALAKAELRFQELYGRRRAADKGQEQTKTPEEIEIEQLNRRLKEVLERHLQRLEPSSSSSGRARWRERLADVGAPMEPRSIRR